MVRDVEKVPVRFIQPNAPYMSGETAWFPPVVAKRFVDRKRAVYPDPPKEADAPPAAETKPKPKAKPKAKAKAKK
jgi:hypothetical protein